MSYLPPFTEPISRLFTRRYSEDVGSSPREEVPTNDYEQSEDEIRHEPRQQPPVPLIVSDSDDSEDDMDQIGRFTFRPFFPSKENIPALRNMPRLPDIPSFSGLPALPTLPT
jgi:hypothetical protein